MHLVIINASPRMEAKSNTARIVRTFIRGFEESGNTTEVWHLSDKKQWTSAKEAYEKNDNILFAIPLYVENVPGIMLEFLETLQPKKEDGTKMSFILQGGFAEASQLRCGEAYLEILPSYFNCEYNGTLIKGDNFGPSWMPENIADKMVAHYEKMGRLFAERGTFDKEEVNEFAAPEYFSEKEIRQHKRIGKWMQKALFHYIAKKNNCKKPLDDKPYQIKKMNCTIRDMTLDDKNKVIEMMRVFYASPAVFSNGSEEIFEKDVEACVGENPYLEGYVFENGSEIQGYAMVAKSFSTEFGKPCIWIEDLYVKDDYRGWGIGSMLLNYLEKKYCGYITRIEAEEENERAIKLYKNNGFEVLPYMEMKK